MKKLPFVPLCLALAFICSEPARADAIWNIQFSQLTPAALPFNQNVNLTFDYEITTAAGVLIFARPFTQGSLTPNYAASGSPVYSPGTGSGSGSITITSGPVTVDHIRFQIFTTDQSQLLLEFFVPVNFSFGVNGIYDIAVTPTSPSGLLLNQNVSVSFNYTTTEPGGALIFARPFSHGALSPNYAASGSPLYGVGSGSGSGTFTITSSDVLVDSIRFQMYNSNESALLLEFFVPVNITIGRNYIRNVVYVPSSPNGMLYDNNVDIRFDYGTLEPSGVYIYPRPYTNGALTPNYSASGSSLYPMGEGTSSGSYRITTGEVTVDSTVFRVYDSGNTTLLFEYFVPADFHYAAHKFTNPTFLPTSPAYFTFNHHDVASFGYVTTSASAVLAWALPWANGSYPPGTAYQGSPFLPPGSGSLTRFFTLLGPSSAVADHSELIMKDSTLAQTLIDWFIPVQFSWGNETVTGVSDNQPQTATAFFLNQNYPNPFNPSTSIRFSLPKESSVDLSVFDLLGRRVATLAEGRMAAGEHTVTFAPSHLASGVYFYRLQAGGLVLSRKLILLK